MNWYKRLFSGSKTEDAPIEAAQPHERAPLSFLARIARGLTRSSGQITNKLTKVFTHKKLDDDTLQELEDILIEADLGVNMAAQLVAALKADRFTKETSVEQVKVFLAEHITQQLAPFAQPMRIADEQAVRHKPHVIVMVGVNGTGKTTTTGKLAYIFGKAGLKTVLAAGDTFRAAAVAQLERWGERALVEVVALEEGKGDAASVAFAAHEQAVAQGADVLIVDTAGRLQNKADLMEELAKLVRVLKKRDASAPHEVILVLDATTGQNAMAQAEVFAKIVGVTGLIITKLDGTARGGIVVPVATTHKLPVHFIGVGESIEDLLPFEAQAYARSLVGLGDIQG